MPPVTTISCGTVFPLADLGPDHEEQTLAEYAVCMKRERKLHKQLRAAVSKGDFLSKAGVYLSSPACAFVAMIEQAKRLPKWKRLPLSTYHALSKKLSLLHPIQEPVEFWHEPKASGNGYRLLHDFGPMHRAAQQMVKQVLSARWKPKPFQYGVEKRGQAAAVEFIKNMIVNGYHYGVALDVKDFFNSFSGKELTKLLPLPKPVIANVVIPESLNLKPKKGAKKPKHSTQGCASISTYPIPSQTVLPQGSACSNIVAAYVVSLLDIVLPAGVVLVMYVDDICLLAKNADDLTLAKNALLLAFGESTAGDFACDISEDTLDNGGLRFLGYHLWFVPGTTKLLVSPTYEATKAHEKECKLREGRIAHSAKTTTKTVVAEHIAGYYSYRLTWAMAFKAADDFPTIWDDAATAFVKLCQKHGVPAPYAKALVGATFAHEIIKTPKKAGGYSEKIKIADFVELSTIDHHVHSTSA